ncbi:MAG: 3 family protein [Bacteroidetes bacterium]|nr:3 family protein [Bacteroidota bacterium]
MVDLLFRDITEKIIGAAFEVHNALGKGLSEKTYENALALKLQRLGLRISQQKELPVMFEGQKVGEQVVDLLVEECVIVEIKAIQNLSRSNEAQLLGYLKNTHFQVGLLINFGDRVEFKRFVYSIDGR